jgi:ectoine hydroxylase-related dioxygenase (phytanoyl-CoA dioxygenase family)
VLKQIFKRFSNALQTDSVIKAKNQIETDGFCVLKNVLSSEECDAITASFDDYVLQNQAEADQFTLTTKRHSRLCNMHLVSEPARTAISKEKVMAVLDEFFGDRAYVATSLFFEQSSEQGIHRDTPFFHTTPKMIFCGIWFALEDVHPDAGPLRYFPGGHRIKITPPKVDSPDQIGEAFSNYCKDIVNQVSAAGIQEQLAFIKKGDCFIWHPELPHGGSPILSPGMTRKSMVFHCAPESTVMHGPEQFFGVTPFSTSAPHTAHLIPLKEGRKMMDHGTPIFATNG